LRDDLAFFIIKLLDVVGWTDKDGGHQNNTEENIAEISEWVFGEGRHVGGGVIDILAKEDRGLLGFYDLLLFRIFCSADRGGDIFNIQRALSKHGDLAAPTDGSIKTIAIEEMREISQKTFKIFEKQYINKNINIFELADNLSIADFTSKYYKFVNEKIDSGEIKNIDEIVGILRTRIKTFVLYQLGNSFVDLGVGCGYYDPSGNKDRKVIKEKINDYLFDKCFNPEIDVKNYEHFVDYLLMNFASVFSSQNNGRKYIPNINEFVKMLDKNRLSDYWKKNGEAIKAADLEFQSKKLYTGNYVATYKYNLSEIYTLMDELVQKDIEDKSS